MNRSITAFIFPASIRIRDDIYDAFSGDYCMAGGTQIPVINDPETSLKVKKKA